MSSSDARFEPMTTGRLLDRCFRIYFQNFPLMVGISAFAYLPALAFQSVDLLVETGADYGPMAIVTGVLAFLIDIVVATPLAIAATTRAVSDRYLGNEVTVGSALKGAWGHIVTLLLTQLVVGLIVMLGLILFILPGIFLILSYALVAPVAILETSDRTAIRQRSWALVEGYRGEVFVVFLCCGFSECFRLLPAMSCCSLPESTRNRAWRRSCDFRWTTSSVLSSIP